MAGRSGFNIRVPNARETRGVGVTPTSSPAAPEFEAGEVTDGVARVVQVRRYVSPQAPYKVSFGVGPKEKEVLLDIKTWGLNTSQWKSIWTKEALVSVELSNDAFRGLFQAGWVLANFGIYKATAESVKGDVKKLREALNKKEFEGDILDDASLVYFGVRSHWEQLDKP
jgi:hypothetical protein